METGHYHEGQHYDAVTWYRRQIEIWQKMLDEAKAHKQPRGHLERHIAWLEKELEKETL